MIVLWYSMVLVNVLSFLAISPTHAPPQLRSCHPTKYALPPIKLIVNETMKTMQHDPVHCSESTLQSFPSDSCYFVVFYILESFHYNSIHLRHLQVISTRRPSRDAGDGEGHG